MPDSPTEEDLASIVGQLKPGWEWVFEHWHDCGIMVKHMARVPLGDQDQWMRSGLPELEEARQRLRRIAVRKTRFDWEDGIYRSNEP
jgi:hypothetical protein